MNQLYRFNHLWLLPAGLLLGGACALSAQTIVPQPFVAVYAGEAAGAGNGNGSTPCANDIPNIIGQHLGDGCLPTQAIIAGMNDVEVDKEGNVYIAEASSAVNGVTTGNDIRVVYNGGTALAAALIGANPQIPNFNPIPGRIYTLVGPLTGLISAQSGIYHCANIITNGVASDALGDGCPGAEVRATSRGMAIDQYGNVIFANATSHYGTRVFFVGGALMANLITLLNPGVVPQPGYVYQLGYNGATGAEGDGGLATFAGTVAARYIAVDSNENVYVSDGLGPSNGISASLDNVRMINGATGIITTIAGETSCGINGYKAATGCPYGFAGDGGPAINALLNQPVTLFLDQNNNLFIADDGNDRLRVVYRGGTLAGISNPVAGNIYTYAGGGATSGVQGTLTVDGTPAQQIKFAALTTAGIDKAGNIYILDSSNHFMWKIDAVTGIGNIIAGGPGSTGGAKAGTYCNAGTSGPMSTDNFGDGCPGLEVYMVAQGTIPFDSMGNFYIASNGATSGTSYLQNLIVQKFSYNNQFPATAVGASVTEPLAFTATASTALTGRSFTLQGAATSEYSDAGGTSCTLVGTQSIKATCVVNVTFTPAHDGPRLGQIQFNTSAGIAGTQILTGSGVASDLAIDNGTVSTIGNSLTPSGVAADLLGNVYVSDSKAGQVLKGPSSGTILTPLITGLKNPSQVTIDNSGNIYIADTGNNRILVTTSTGITLASLGSGLSSPTGVAVDAYGQIFAADTGNNRIVQLSLNGNQLNATSPALSIPLSAPTQLGFDPGGNLYILDSGNQRIVEYVYSTGVPVVVGLDVGVVPTAFAIDPAGDIYVADTTSKSVLDYYAGAIPGFDMVVGLITPVGIATDPDGNLFIADAGMKGAVELRRSLANITFPLTNAGSTTNAAITVDNVGNAALNFTAPLDVVSGTNAALFSLAPATTAPCAAGTAFAVGGSCNFIASFTPAVAGSDSATATFVSNATNTTTAVAKLSGTAAALPTPTTTTLTVLPAGGVFYSEPVTLKAVLTATPLTTTPTGTFILTVDGKTEEPPVSVGNGTVTFTLDLPIGNHTLSVTYSGGSPYASSAATVMVPVQAATTTTSLTITPQSSNGIASLLFSSTVSATTAVHQTGNVSIWAGPVGTGTLVCSKAIDPVTYSISCVSASLSISTNVFTAVYSGSSNGYFAPSQSAPLTPSSGDFIVAPVVSTFVIPQGGVGQLSVNVVSLYSSSGDVSTSCTGLPANSTCRFTPNLLTLGSNEAPVSVLVQIYTDVPSTLASNDHGSTARGIFLALGLPLGLGLLRMRRRASLRLLAVFVFGLCLIAGTSGCGGGTILQTVSTLVTPTGNYNLTLIFTGASATGETATHSTTASFTVLPAPSN